MSPTSDVFLFLDMDFVSGFQYFFAVNFCQLAGRHKEHHR